MRSPRRFRPTVGGLALEERVVLSTAPVAEVSALVVIDPLNKPPQSIVKGGTVSEVVNQIHAAYKRFMAQVLRACNNAATGLSNGKNPNDLLAGLKTFTSIQSGTLETQVQRASRLLPAGNQYLYLPPAGVLPPGTAYPAINSTTCGPDLRFYVPPAYRLQTQIQNLLTTLNSATTLDQFCSPQTQQTILGTYRTSRQATVRYATCANTNGDFTVPGWKPVGM